MNPSLKKYNNFLLLLENPNNLEAQITKYFEEEFNELFEDILIKSDKEFMDNLLFNSKFVIEDNFSSDAMKNSTLIQIIKKKEREFYVKLKMDKEKLTKVLKYKGKDFIGNGQNFSFLKHCIYQKDIPIHMCNEKNNFVTVLTEFSTGINEIKNIKRRNSLSEYKNIDAIICTNCLKAYKGNYVKLLCNFCKIPYYTRILSFNENANNNFQPATWEKYHCNIIINQQMLCPKCNHTLYIDIQNDKLICLNCHFSDEAENIEWNCIKCNQKFYSNAKIYNPYIFKPYANAIKKGLLEKISAVPKRLQCGHNPENIIHKKNCSGKLYITQLNNCEMIICSKCRAMNKFDKFIFECPECGKKIKGNEENLEDKFKEFSISSTPKINKKISFNIKSSEIKLKTPRNALSSFNLCQTEKNEKKKFYSSTKSLVYSPDKKLISGISNANTTNTENINKDSYNEIDNNTNNNIFFVPKQKKSFHFRNHNSDIAQNIINNLNKDKRKFSRSLVIKTKKIRKEELDNYCSSSEDEFDDPKNIINKRESNNEEEIEKKNSFNDEEKQKKIISNDIIPYFEPNGYMIISQIGEGKKSKIFCVKSDYNQFYAMKKKVLTQKSDLDKLLYSYKLQYELMNDTNVTKINSINYSNEEFSVLEELGINCWNSEIATMKKMKKFYSEEDLINIIYQISTTLQILQKKNLCHFNINPKNIIVFKNHFYKLSDFEYIKSIKDPNIIPNDNNFISPQLYHLYTNKEKYKKINLIKNDVYSLGLCIIYTMTRTNELNNIFKDFISRKSNVEVKSLIRDYFKYPLNTLDDDNFYSLKFETLINYMLKEKESERFDFSQIIQYLCKEYEFED